MIYFEVIKLYFNLISIQRYKCRIRIGQVAKKGKRDRSYKSGEKS